MNSRLSLWVTMCTGSWIPVQGEKLKAIIELKNIENKSTKRKNWIVFCFLQALDSNICLLEITDKTISQGDGKGMKVPCNFPAEKRFINSLK